MIVVRFMGGFANQLFQYALFLQLEEKQPDNKIYADISSYKEKSLHGGFKLDAFVDFSYFNKKIDASFIRVTENNYSDVELVADSNYYFDGYWQSPQYFPKSLDKISTIFSEDKLVDANKEFLQKITLAESVSIHVRRGDYEHDVILGNVATGCFYQNAIDKIVSDNNAASFFVFSDDIAWCKDNLDYKGHEVTFITGNEKAVHLDIALMSRCKDNVISNSSFSWWASHLNTNKDKKIYMPEYWFNEPNAVSEISVPDAITLPNTPIVREPISEPLFTIVVKAKGCAPYLRRCMSSVLNQTFTDFQVVVEGDNAEENLISEYTKRDCRVVFVNNEIETKGKNVLFINGSDFLDIHALEVLAKEIEIYPDEIIEFDAYIKPGYVSYTMDDGRRTAIDGILQEYQVRPIWNKCCPREMLAAAENPISSARYMNKILYYYVISANDNYREIISKLTYRPEDHTLFAKIKRKMKQIFGMSV